MLQMGGKAKETIPKVLLEGQWLAGVQAEPGSFKNHFPGR